MTRRFVTSAALLACLMPSASGDPATIAESTWLPLPTAVTGRTPATPYAGIASDMSNRQIVVFGGYGATATTDRTWVWDGRAWMQRNPAASPSARWVPGMTYDAARGNVVLFGGGSDLTAPLGDTWTWNGITWTQRAPATSPPARLGAAMAYDATRGQVVLFGGLSATGTLLADTWTWDGTTWTQRTPAAAPSPRYYTSAAADASGGVVLFGGYGANAALRDTWTWDGVTWTQRASDFAPSSRFVFALAYDPGRRMTVLFGGAADALGTRLDDTWTWSGQSWTQRGPVVSPTARYGAELAFDAARGFLLLTGGVAAAGNADDTYLYTGVITATPIPPQ